MHTSVCICVCVCGDLGNRPMGGPVGGRVGRISYSVQHSYWSLDANNGRAKEDFVCAYPLLLSCCPVVPLGSVWYRGCTLWGGSVHLEDWPACLSACLAFPLPQYMQGGVRLELRMERHKHSHISHQLDKTYSRQNTNQPH